MAFDLIRTHFSLALEKDVKDGEEFTEEGLCVVRELVSGVEKVKPSDGTSGGDGEGLLGFALRDTQDNATRPVVESVTVGTSGTYSTITLDNNNLVTGSVSAFDDTADSALTVVTEPTNPSAGEVSIDFSAGTARFLVSAEGGNSVRLFYRYNLTVEERKRLFHERSVNNTAAATFAQVSVMGGHGALYTTEYDTNDDWTTGGTVYTGASGRITKASTSGVVVGEVISLPTVDDPLLGVAFDTLLG